MAPHELPLDAAAGTLGVSVRTLRRWASAAGADGRVERPGVVPFRVRRHGRALLFTLEQATIGPSRGTEKSGSGRDRQSMAGSGRSMAAVVAGLASVGVWLPAGP